MGYLREKELETLDLAGVSGNKSVSIVIATAGGAQRISRALSSIFSQTLDAKLIEVIIVVNGPDPETYSEIRNESQLQSQVKIRWIYSGHRGVGIARNIGIQAARYNYLTFLDDDDYFQPDFLRQSVEARTAQDSPVIVLSPIVDLGSEGRLDTENALFQKIHNLPNTPVALSDHPWILGFNACKLFETALAKKMYFPEDLNSGEDTVFFAQLLKYGRLRVLAIKYDGANAYVRQKRDGSVSRRTSSFEFNVVERLQVAQQLNSIEVAADSHSALRAQIRSQYNFILRFVREHPGIKDRVYEYLKSVRPAYFPWEEFQTGQATTLIFSYCFAPFSDSSANVVAKLVDNNEEFVDVISADMSKVRKTDPMIMRVVDPWVKRHTIVQGSPSFSEWSLIIDFAQKAQLVAARYASSPNRYRKIYSRSMWVGSHVAAAFYKLSNPQVEWEAELSDPTRRGSNGERRQGIFNHDKISKRFLQILKSKGWSDLQIDTSFDLIEAITFVLADKLVFTNQNQLNFILSDYPKHLRGSISAKAIVRAHPIPREYFYHIARTTYDLSPRAINIGYFGNFYANRNLSSFVTALEKANTEIGKRFVLHVFGGDKVHHEELRMGEDLPCCVRLNEPVPYLHFLNLASKMDVLLVSDVEFVKPPHLNPFLPSKMADYLGSEAAVWKIVQQGSPMARIATKYTSELGRSQSLEDTFRRIAIDFD